MKRITAKHNQKQRILPPGDVTTGEVKLAIEVYEGSNFTYTSQCIVGLSSCNRLRICVTMDKNTYNANLVANDGSGSFDNNFKFVNFGLIDSWPGEDDDIAFTETFQIQGVQQDDDNFTVCAFLTIKDEWAGTTIFPTIQFRFSVNNETEYVNIPMRFTVNPDNNFDALEVIDFVEMDRDGTTRIITDKICDSAAFVCLRVRRLLMNPGAKYKTIWFLRSEGEDWKEYDGFVDPGAIPQLQNISAVFPTGTTSDDPAKLQLIGSALEIGICYEVKAVSINMEPGDITLNCPDVDVLITLEIQTVGPSNTIVKYTIDFPGYTEQLSSFTYKINDVDFSLGTSYPIQSAFIVEPDVNGQISTDFYIQIATASGCLYNVFIQNIIINNTIGEIVEQPAILTSF